MSNTHHLARNKKIYIIALTIILAGGLVAGVLWWRHTHPPRYVTQKCSEYGPSNDFFDGPSSIKEMANDSVAVVVATVNSDVLKDSFFPSDPTPHLRVKETLKGAIRSDSVISICPGMGRADLPAKQTITVVAFLENKDGNKWIPLWGPIGVVPQGKDGEFAPRGLSEEPKSVSLDELRKIIK